MLKIRTVHAELLSHPVRPAAHELMECMEEGNVSSCRKQCRTGEAYLEGSLILFPHSQW